MTKKTLSKLLSLLLAVVFVAGLIPAGSIAFAAATDTEEFLFTNTTDSNISVANVTSYDFTGLENSNWHYLGHTGGNLRRIAPNDFLWFQSRSSTEPAWLALKLKFNNETLTPGVYTLKMDTLNEYVYNNTCINSLNTFYFGKYVADQNDGAAYMTTGNLLNENMVLEGGEANGVARTRTISTEVSITDMASEYVFVYKPQGADVQIASLVFERTGDLPTTEPEEPGDEPDAEFVTSETFSFENFAASNTYLARVETYKKNTSENENWTFFGASQDYYVESSSGAKTWSAWSGRSVKASDTTPGYLRVSDQPTINDAWTSFKLQLNEVLEPGEYKLTYDLRAYYPGQGYSAAGVEAKKHFGLYLAPYVDGQNSGEYYKKAYNIVKPLGTIEAFNNEKETKTFETDSFYLEETTQDLILVIELEGCELNIVNFALERVGELPVDAEKSLNIPKSMIKVGETVAPSINLGEKKSIVSVISLESDSTDAAAISATGAIVGKAEGPAKITATVGSNTYDAPIEVVVDPRDTAFITLGEEDVYNAFNAAAPEALVYLKDGTEAKAGTAVAVANGDGTYKMTATAEDGYTFLYWAKGLTANKKILSFDEEFNYIPVDGSNILIAVFEKTGADETPKAEFYAGNGQLVATLTEGDTLEAPALPAMPGREAIHWAALGDKTLAAEASFELSGGTEIWVAQYDTPKKVNIELEGATCENTSFVYGDKVELTAVVPEGNEFCWWEKENVEGKIEIVGVSDTYTFYAWEDCTVKAVSKPAFVPYTGRAMKILIDTFEGNSVMAEFIGFDGVDVLEKGIKLGNTYHAMTTNNNQFTIVNKSGDTATGYAIFKIGDKTYGIGVEDGE